MIYRAAKNTNGVIIAIGSDESQSGNYPSGSVDGSNLGVWCSWTDDIANLPSITAPVVGLDPTILTPLRYKENAGANGLELRPDADVVASPNA